MSVPNSWAWSKSPPVHKNLFVASSLQFQGMAKALEHYRPSRVISCDGCMQSNSAISGDFFLRLYCACS